MRDFLRRLSKANKNTFKDVIKHASKDELRYPVAHTTDIMRKKIPASPKLIKLIKKHRAA